jgi:superfamily II DNA or RNA helicase
MESKARVLQAQECGSLLLSRSRTPYVVGCLLPHTVLRASEITSTKLEAKVAFHKGQAALDLHAHVESGGHQHTIHVLLAYAQHSEFLQHLTEASALYLLTGTDHPVAYADSEQPDRKTLYQRVHSGGLTIEVTEAVRSQILLLSDFHHAIPASFEQACVL